MKELSNLKISKILMFAGILLFFYFECARCQQLICEVRNPEGHTPRKTVGDGGFRIVVVGNHSKVGHYSPNDVYTVTIQGLKTRYSTQKFTEFLLVAESEKQSTMGQTGLMTTGVFHIMDDSHSRFSDQCPDGVTNVNMHPKSEISVMWTAPSTLVASCITFKATVVERPHIWYRDDGQLTKTLCPAMPRRMRNRQQPHRQLSEDGSSTIMAEKRNRLNKNQMFKPDEIPSGQGYKISEIMAAKQNHQMALKNNQQSPQVNPKPKPVSPVTQQQRHIPNHPSQHSTSSSGSTPIRCCACDEAKYEVKFEGIWSKDTHPKDFPENEWLLHFSDIIGASHSTDYNVWRPGEIASEGIRQVAEWGATRHLERELKSKSHQINTIIKAKGLWHPDERGTTSAAFRVDKEHHLMSLVSMIGPSPDWIVGITSFNLCLPNCTWLEEADFDLYPYDAGTDSGITYMSPNTPTEPRQRIRALTSNDPDDSRSPFFGVEPMQPFAKAHIRRQRIYPKGCNDTSTATNVDHEIYLTENSEDISRPECAVSEWTSWSDCSVTCGKGLRMRKRSYLIPMKADMFRCDRQLVEKEMCLGDEQSCGSDNVSMFEEVDSICAVTPWSDWTPCSITCGKGTRNRFRRYKNHMGRKKCNLEMTQSEMCVITMDCNSTTGVADDDENCPMTPWSQWTPCSVTCGIGIRERTRFPLLTDEIDIRRYCKGDTTQRATCTGEFGISCQITMKEAKEICSLPADNGSCRNDQTKYHFNMDKGMCVPFQWSGCKGNRNRFDTENECNEVCGFLGVSFPPERIDTITTTITVTTAEPATVAVPTNDLTTPSPPASISSPPFELRLVLPPSTTSEPTTTQSTQIPTITDSQPIDQSDADLDDEISGDDGKDLENNGGGGTLYQQQNFDDFGEGRRIDCVVSRWSSWSHCSVTCGVGRKTRVRSVLIQPQNGGKQCPRLYKKKPCTMDPC